MNRHLNFDKDIFMQTELITPSRIKAVRKKYGMTQMDFADLLGVKYITYGSWERGDRNPSSPAYALLKIAENYPEIFLANRREIIMSIMKYFKASRI